MDIEINVTSPELDLPPIRLSATASVSCASLDNAPSDMAPVQNLRGGDVGGRGGGG